ncbi:uncharacterized protein NECHADRAFT_48249 [Fusarium vanettenii 77-13-4]|uniref:Nephrocystin 3-like N-terminal domain-containing protein n=1 Tax=Fusarium vanettenii (strain ATCC MYA-4622 / CBS 123669 / FGSC 9596 / NRRL 45880 / 77-13-4) TaxID=660122 RepID=C7ZCW4_FUSV7|nr:uncharacterized protein NECHADRAFT_48249 [Fusarium vanettenii 77-13-4]EEU37989.1 hypothetical protein NECHADRAFT_48249 [Fusarium vanettenii 77-13-4]
MSTSTSRLGAVLDTYFHKRLERSIHPAIAAARDKSDATKRVSQPWHPHMTIRMTTFLCMIFHNPLPFTGLTYSSEEIYRDAEREKQRFKTAMEEYENTTQGSKFKTEVTDKCVHTWNDALTEVQRAEETYYDASGMWGKIRKGLRSLGRNSKAFEAWASLLPSGSEYFSVLFGGFRLIFRVCTAAAARLHDLRSDICDALAEIPALLQCTHVALGIFKRSKELHQASAALYSAIIAALHHIVVCIFQQDSYASQLDGLLDEVRQLADRFNSAACLCSYERIQTISQTVQAQSIQERENQKELVGYLEKSSDEFQHFKAEFQSKAGDLQVGLGRVEWQVTNISNILARFLSSDSRMNPRTQDIRGPNLPIRRAKSETKLAQDICRVREGLMSEFDYDSSVIQTDIAANLHGVWQIPRPDQDRLVAAMQSRKLQSWITKATSSAMFLNFNAPRNQKSTSFIAAKLIDSIQASVLKEQDHTSSVLVVSFFCGSHSRPNDPDFGADGMMRSLIIQLLLSYPGFSPHIIRRIQAANLVSITDLCEIFHLLIGQLPHHRMVFCILDGVTVFEESKSLREESEILIKELMEVLRWTAEYGCCFKLLLTSPWNSRILYRYLPDPENDSVWLPTKVPSQGGFTLGKWEGSVGVDLDKLQIIKDAYPL